MNIMDSVLYQALLLLLFSFTVLFIVFFVIKKTIANPFIVSFDSVYKYVQNKTSLSYSKPSEEDKKTKDKKKDKYLELEVLQNVDNNMKNESILTNNNEQKIVGVKVPVFGNFTKKIASEFIDQVASLDPEEIEDKGYYQATEIAKSKNSGKSVSTRQDF